VSGVFLFIGEQEMKKVLDMTCAGRMMWFEKENPSVVYMDKRSESIKLCDETTYTVNPNVVANFAALPFVANTFHLVLFDPPHIVNLSPKSWLAQKYGALLPSWRHDLKEGFAEGMRVLKPCGTLIFKWNEARVKTSEVVALFSYIPLFGHQTAKHGKTKWMTYMKDTG
jgi:ubiquinone/menaquinone biosynthesis C-methylase UbiE